MSFSQSRRHLIQGALLGTAGVTLASRFGATSMARDAVLGVDEWGDVSNLGSVFNTTTSKRISGDYYDWTKTKLPEKPWNHQYHQTLVMKIRLSARNNVGSIKTIYVNFKECLRVIQKLDNLTLGIPKIIYLVDWHDSRYPAWDEAAKALKRSQDESAWESLRWLMREARKYNTVVSLHINMIDASKHSSLWQSYMDRDIIAKDIHGIPIPGEVFVEQSYQISYTQEWEMGLAQRRIDGLVRMLPELKDAGTVHIDAFHSIRPLAYHSDKDHDLMSPFLGYSDEQEIATQRKIFRYWRMHGIDATAEVAMYELRKDPFIGLQPFAWWYLPEQFEKRDWLNKPPDFTGLPPSLYCGTPMHAEEEIKKDPETLASLTEKFCTDVVAWYFNNSEKSSLYDRNLLSFKKEDIFVPALWLDKTIVAFSASSYRERICSLPSAWGGVDRVTVAPFGIDGIGAGKIVPVKDAKFELEIKAGQALVVSAT